MRSAGVEGSWPWRDGCRRWGDDVPCLHNNTGTQSFPRLGVGVDRYISPFSALIGFMLDNHGMAKIVFKHSPDHTVVHRRDAGFFIKTKQSPGAILVKAQIDALMGEIPLSVIPPPLVRCTKEHARAEGPAFKIPRNKGVGLEEHFGKTGLRKSHIRLRVYLRCGLYPQTRNGFLARRSYQRRLRSGMP
jgi:sRNA-binding regulator protein Hfq